MMKKAFTLAEIFITMVILAVLVSVSIVFFTNKKDYEREYLYYSAYVNLLAVVDNALSNDAYFSPFATKGIEIGQCNNGARCRVFKNIEVNLCNVFNDYFNTTKATCSSTQAVTNMGDGSKPALVLINGMEISFYKPSAPSTASLCHGLSDLSGEVNESDRSGWEVVVDINGNGKGEDKLYYDKMPFYVTRSWKVIPRYGEVEGIRGYQPAVSAPLDAGGNASLMAFDVVYTKVDSPTNKLSVLEGGHNVSFREAACLSGYLHEDDSYCSYVNPSVVPPVHSADKSPNCTDAAACRVRVVKKLKRAR